jgi:uncharacterized Zn finger protein
MPSVADLVEKPALELLTGPEGLLAGQELADAGSVHIIEFAPIRVVADVDDDGEEAHVVLAVAGSTLEWSCDCKHGPAAGACEHIAAVGLETSRRSPGRRRQRATGST